MSFLIKREKGFDGNFPSFKTSDAASRYIEDNTGAFDNNETIAIIDFSIPKVIFIKLELTIVPRIIN